MEHGWGFYWPPCSVPFLVKPGADFNHPVPKEDAIMAEVIHNIPYLRERPTPGDGNLAEPPAGRALLEHAGLVPAGGLSAWQ